MTETNVFQRSGQGRDNIDTTSIWWIANSEQNMTEVQVRRFPLPPPEMIQAVGGSDYDATGNHFYNLFTQHCELKPEADVLDIGAGCGRIAVQLVDHLAPESEYHGIDVVKSMVDWCKENITPQAPNFHFHHADLANSLYNEAQNTAANYRFPFEDSKFDFVIATSLFTHLNPEDSANYLREIRRVLRDDGRAFLTFYLLTDAYWRNRRADHTKVVFDHGERPYWFNDPNVPEAVCAYEDRYAFDMMRDAGLDISVVSYGRWKYSRGWSFQDIILAHRAQSAPTMEGPAG